MRPSLQLIKWHHHPNRKVAVSLHRLRSGHNYLNAFSHRIDPVFKTSLKFVLEILFLL